jgi:hypothetical protein
MSDRDACGQEIKTLCFTREHDELLARGYPHVAILEETGTPAKKAAKLAATLAGAPQKITANHRVRFPAEVAPHFVRGAHAREFHDWTRNQAIPDAAFAEGGKVGEDEARALIAKSVEIPGCSFNVHNESMFFLLEQLVGTEVVVDATLGALEALPEKRWTHEESGPDRKTGGAAFLLGFLFLRLRSEVRKKHEARYRALLARVHALCDKANSKSFELVSGAEKVLLGFQASALASPGPYVYLGRYVFATDDLERLRALVANKDTIYEYGNLDVRFVYLLGADVLTTIGKHRPMKEAVRATFEDLGMIRHEALVPLFLEYVGKPMAKELPLQWFRAHAEFAKPILEKSKDAKAKAILGQI